MTHGIPERLLLIEDGLRNVTAKLGYEVIRDPETYAKAPIAVWWFTRSGRVFRAEIIRVRARYRPSIELTVEFFGSDVPLTELRRVGLEGHAGGFGLFQYQFYSLGKDVNSILPPAIQIKRDNSSGAILERLSEEIREVDARVWVDLWKTSRQEAGGGKESK